MVGAFEQAMLALMIFVIMLGMGASLTPRDFYLALRRPYGLAIGVISQYGFMPFIGFLLASLLTVPEAIAVGILIMSCMPGGTTSNIFTYFSKGNLALSVLMTVTSTVAGVVLIPIILVLYATALDLEIPRENIIITLILLLVPVGIGMVLRKISANVGAVTEFFGSALALFFILFLMVSWIPRNWQFLLETTAATYVASIGLGLFGIAIGYAFARSLRLHPRNARTVALETGIQNGPLAVAIIVFTFGGEAQGQSYMAVPVLYSLFIVIISTLVTLVFRRANTAAEQKMPDSLL
ncbi:MAG: bile acid:sodium symporter family protein [Pseudomonadota bacterium]